MNAVLPDANVSGYEPHMSDLHLPDPNDRHVVAVGIACRASTIVTWNLRDFPRREIEPFGIKAQTPDAFCAMARHREADLLISVLRARLNLRQSLPSPSDFIDHLRRQRLSKFAALLEPNLHQI